MNAPDFAQWAKDRKVCVRGLQFQRGRSSTDFWYHCRRGDWLCWILDWTLVKHPNSTPMWERPWWVLFLRGLYGREDLSTEAMFKLFDAWDRFLHLSHDDTFLLEYKDMRQNIMGTEIVYKWDWDRAANAVRTKFHDPMAGKIYEPFKPVPEYKPEVNDPGDYPAAHMKDILGDS